MKNTYLGLCIATAFLFSCNNETKTETIGASDSTNINSSAPSTGPDMQSPTTNGESAAIPVNADQISVTPTQNPVSNSAGMNPEHGQPGHRCDISVGAPLNSAPSTPASSQQSTGVPLNTPTISTAPTMISAPEAQPPASSAPVSTAPGMNPPHGQPGHDCAIAVGAPLKK